MATLPLKALWIGDKPVEFSEGSALDTDLQSLTVTSLETRLPLGHNEKVAVRVELTNGRVYEGQATTTMPRDVARRGFPTIHVYGFTAKAPLAPVD
jgi:hypothetical protein